MRKTTIHDTSIRKICPTGNIPGIGVSHNACINTTRTKTRINLGLNSMFSSKVLLPWTRQKAAPVKAAHATCPPGAKKLRTRMVEYRPGKLPDRSALNEYPAVSKAAKPAPTAAPKRSPLRI